MSWAIIQVFSGSIWQWALWVSIFMNRVSFFYTVSWHVTTPCEEEQYRLSSLLFWEVIMSPRACYFQVSSFCHVGASHISQNHANKNSPGWWKLRCCQRVYHWVLGCRSVVFGHMILMRAGLCSWNTPVIIN